MQTIIQHKLVSYDRQGKGKTVLILHGWGAQRKTMHALAQKLTQRFDVINVDLPGFGESEAPLNPFDLSAYARWLDELCTKLGVSPYAVVGHSHGGAVAVKYAALGFNAEKLVLLGAAGIRQRKRLKKSALKAVSKVGKAVLSIVPKTTRMNIQHKWYKRIGSELYDVRGMEETFKRVVAEDLTNDARHVRIPSLLIYGAHDNATPLDCAEAYQRSLISSQLVVVENAGHYAFIDAPKVVYDAMEKFL